MTLIDRPELSQRHQLIFGTVSALRHHGVEDRAAVAFGENKAVSFGPFRVSRVMPHDIEEQRHYDVCGGKRPSWMTRSSLGNHFDCLAPHLLCKRCERACIVYLLHDSLTM